MLFNYHSKFVTFVNCNFSTEKTNREVMKKIPLNILGLSYSKNQAGAYALVLAEENGKHRIPIIIGNTEAQSIAMQLEGLKPQRPLTHDLFQTFGTAFGITVKEVIITKLESGIFYSEMVCQTEHTTIKIDSRTSDAIAIALRFKAPIYTTQEVIEQAGIVFDFTDNPPEKTEQPAVDKEQFKYYSLEQLEHEMQKAINEEHYEKASYLRDEIKRRKENK